MLTPYMLTPYMLRSALPKDRRIGSDRISNNQTELKAWTTTMQVVLTDYEESVLSTLAASAAATFSTSGEPHLADEGGSTTQRPSAHSCGDYGPVRVRYLSWEEERR